MGILLPAYGNKQGIIKLRFPALLLQSKQYRNIDSKQQDNMYVQQDINSITDDRNI
jgi:hypothetical protein